MDEADRTEHIVLCFYFITQHHLNELLVQYTIKQRPITHRPETSE